MANQGVRQKKVIESFNLAGKRWRRAICSVDVMHANDRAAEPTIHPRWANDAPSVRTLAEKEPEEREAPAAHLAVRHANHLAATRVFASLDGNVRDLAL